MISQVSIFIENETGRLADVMRDIARANINVHTLFVADTESFGVVRLLCDYPESTLSYLRKKGWRAQTTEMVAVRIPNKPGGLSDILDIVEQAEINVEYVYCVSVNDRTAIDVLKVEDGILVEKLLQAAGYELVEPEEIYELS